MNLLQCTNACRASRADVRRRHLIDTARALFTENGFHSTGVAQIAAASGIRVGQIYRDFQNKEEIVAAIVETDLGEFLDEDALAEAIAAGDCVAIRSWIGRFVRSDDPVEECRLMTEIAAEAARNARIAAINRAMDARTEHALSLAIDALVPGESRAGQRAGLVSLILALGMGLIYRRVVVSDEEARRLTRHMEAVIDREFATLLPECA